MKKIAFLVLHLGYGGAEQAVISEANLLCERYAVEIISFYKLLEKPAFDLDSRVQVVYLTEGIKPNRDELKKAIAEKAVFHLIKEGARSAQTLYWRTKKMKMAIQKSDADIIISSRYLYHKLLVDNAKENVICIAQEHNHHNDDEKYIQQQINAVKNMDYFMPVSRDLTDFYSERLFGEKVKCKYIAHHLETLPEKISTLSGKNIISVGRLSKEKGFGELIEVFREIHEGDSEYKLHIIGDGDEREVLEKKISEYKLQDDIILHGFQGKDYIEKVMYQSSVYMMTSFTESFGLVLIEAQSYGIPCVAYDSAQGAKEIIKSGINGILIPDRDRTQMVSETLKLLTDYDYRKSMGNESRKNAEKYSKKNIANQWYDFIDKIGGTE